MKIPTPSKKAALLLLPFVAACAAGANELAGVPDPAGVVAGFWQGLWHGLISPVAFVVSLFNETVSVYEVHNSGVWYNLGFLLGASSVFGGGGSKAAKRARK